jgi:DNA-binding CsgD family transcriptional regulator
MPRRKLPEPTPVIAERIGESGRRRLALTAQERERFQEQELIERAVSYYLDIYDKHSTQDIADALGISVHSLRNLIRSEEFEKVYSRHYVELGHDPRLQATRNAMVDLLGDSMEALKDVLARGTGSAKVQAIKMVWDYVGIKKPDVPDSDRKEAIEFLKEAGIKVENVNVNLPPEYAQAIDGYDNAVDGEFRDVPTPELPDDTGDTAEGVLDETLGGDISGDAQVGEPVAE